jgi:hypothetical protein
MFSLLDTTEQQGQTNIPILDVMTNEQMAEAIESRFKPDFTRGVVKSTNEMKKYVRTLRNEPERVFIDPCYDAWDEDEDEDEEFDRCEDFFTLSFGFSDETN